MESETMAWKEKVVSPDIALGRIEPGMRIFLGTGAAEPRMLIRRLMASDGNNLQDLELIQLVSFGEAISLDEIRDQKYRLKTFFSGWVASEAITEGRIDIIPSRFSRIPSLIESGQIRIDAAIVQVTPPNESGYCSLGVAVDVARPAMDQAALVIGEINPRVPYTHGDTFVPISEFDLLVEATQPPISLDRLPAAPVFEKVAEHVASVIEDRSCIAFSIGPLYDALGRQLVHKRDLGIHSPFFTDALMDLVKSGAVTNRYKGIFRGKSVVSYGFGSPELYKWLNRNPLVDFQGIDKVFSPTEIGRNPRFVSVFPARKVDLSGRVALHAGRGNISAGPGEVMDFVNGTELSRGGRTIFALPSRNRRNEGNIRLSVDAYPNLFTLRESIDMVVTEYGAASLTGRSVRERAQTLIEIAHPDDRADLVARAKAERILYPDQIFLSESAHLYPSQITEELTLKGGERVRFRAIRPSDEEEMRRLFYRFSDDAVYYRYFSPIKTMPHARMQEYVNVDYRQVMSIVGLVGRPGRGHIIAEARFARDRHRPWADVAFVVDDAYQGQGIATYLYALLVPLARERGLQGFRADVLASNKAMMKVFEKGDLPAKASLDHGAYELTIPFDGNR
jgi:acyl-CoA hydrolase/GNAT superfamily N-acetyltransferase